MKWVTRERPKTDRIACPWLIRKFIDHEAEFLYVPADGVLSVANFHLLELDDHRQLELCLPVYDALYAWCRNEVESAETA